MPKGKSDVPVFKPYDQHQLELIPPTADELIPKNHLVRVVSRTIDQMDLTPLLAQYDKGGGASRFHPLMLLKVLVYGYMNKVYTGRMLAKSLRENIPFRWLAGAQTPDFRTINTFRSSKLKAVIDEVFMASVKILARDGYIQLKNYFVDGTKIEANANKYTFVWGNAVDTFERKLDQNLKALLKEIQNANDQEDAQYGEKDLEEMEDKPLLSSQDIKDLAEMINQRIRALAEESKPTESTQERKKKLVKLHQKVTGDYLVRKMKYEKARFILAGRRSYSKTDNDATFMRMKEDPMKNGQLKPGYNVQIGTENGFVVGFDVFPNPTDTLTLKPHLENMKQRLGTLPGTVIADAGYGSEENYEYLERSGVRAAVKYSYFHAHQRKGFKRKVYQQENWPYDIGKDEYTCPQGAKARFEKLRMRRSENGFEAQTRLYKVEGCGACPVRNLCTKSEECRRLEVNPRLTRYKAEVRTFLNSEEGVSLRKRRCIEVEPVFARIKQNGGYRRFILRGKEKVRTEWGLLSLAQNLKWMARS